MSHCVSAYFITHRSSAWTVALLECALFLHRIFPPKRRLLDVRPSRVNPLVLLWHDILVLQGCDALGTVIPIFNQCPYHSLRTSPQLVCQVFPSNYKSCSAIHLANLSNASGMQDAVGDLSSASATEQVYVNNGVLRLSTLFWIGFTKKARGWCEGSDGVALLRRTLIRCPKS
uniref:Secreted protein n=1 Tax=Steinernema glaseri TaxID=37863 RepID=A0A1I7YN11_9BILA